MSVIEFQIEPGDPAGAATTQVDNGRLVIVLPEADWTADKNEILEIYGRYFPLVYGANILDEFTHALTQPQVDRALFALYWETKSGQKVYAFPQKNANRQVFVFATWLA